MATPFTDQLVADYGFDLSSLPSNVNVESFAMGRVLNKSFEIRLIRGGSRNNDSTVLVRPRTLSESFPDIIRTIAVAKEENYLKNVTDLFIEPVAPSRHVELYRCDALSDYLPVQSRIKLFSRAPDEDDDEEVAKWFITPDPDTGYLGMKEEIENTFDLDAAFARDEGISNELPWNITNELKAKIRRAEILALRNNRKRPRSSSNLKSTSTAVIETPQAKSTVLLDLPPEIIQILGGKLESWKQYMRLRGTSRNLYQILKGVESKVGEAVARIYGFTFPTGVRPVDWNSFYMGVEIPWEFQMKTVNAFVESTYSIKAWYTNTAAFNSCQLDYIDEPRLDYAWNGFLIHPPLVSNVRLAEITPNTVPIEWKLTRLQLPYVSSPGVVLTKVGSTTSRYIPYSATPAILAHTFRDFYRRN